MNKFKNFSKFIILIISIVIFYSIGLAKDVKLKPIFNGSRMEKKVTLTFDDGPHPIGTPQILSVLKRHQVKATFFMIAKQVKKFPEIALQVKKEGHDIGSHTITHPKLKKCSEKQLQEEIGGSVKIIQNYTGFRPKYFRPSYGHYDQNILKIAEKYGMKTVLWEADAADYRSSRSKATIK
ncbi:MAG: polysaccharide deacetylase family protein, partial [Candidatus Margulisbacteria bacterium]|nr:polysaccharide deacetylase family protein [Candidatus Margulisiibacteriota bacterium]